MPDQVIKLDFQSREESDFPCYLFLLEDGTIIDGYLGIIFKAGEYTVKTDHCFGNDFRYVVGKENSQERLVLASEYEGSYLRGEINDALRFRECYAIFVPEKDRIIIQEFLMKHKS